jgi:hypothetical protein
MEKNQTDKLSYERKSPDLTGRLLPAILVWGVPVGLIVWSGCANVAMRWIWPAAFGFMGRAGTRLPATARMGRSRSPSPRARGYTSPDNFSRSMFPPETSATTRSPGETRTLPARSAPAAAAPEAST